MKKSYGLIGLIVSFMAMACTMVFYPSCKLSAKAAEEVKFSLLEPLYASSLESLNYLGIDQTLVDDFTPFNDFTFSRMSGKSLKPALSGAEEGYKVASVTLDVSNKVSLIDESKITDVSDMSLNLWVNFDKKKTDITRGLSISLEDNSGTNSIIWNLDANTLQHLLERDDIGTYDKLVFGSQSLALIGWCKLELPFSKSVTTGEILNGGEFTFSKLSVRQTDGYFADDQPILLYDIYLIEKVDLTDYALTIQDYANISVKSSANVVDNNKQYYIGEYFNDTLSKTEVFNACFVGRTNYLDASNSSLLVVEADPEMGTNKIKTFSYGSGSFEIEESSYKIKYCIKYNNRNVSILSDSLTATSYGKGIWLEPISGNLTKGQQYNLYYSVHQAFTGDAITFTSSNEEILKIISVDKINKFITVEANKVGEVTITATLQDDRLVGTDYEDTGIVNDSFTISVEKEIKNVNTTKIMLWIALGLMIIGLIYLAVVEIIKSRKIEIK